jgi:hypothetical protein
MQSHAIVDLSPPKKQASDPENGNGGTGICSAVLEAIVDLRMRN